MDSSIKMSHLDGLRAYEALVELKCPKTTQVQACGVLNGLSHRQQQLMDCHAH